MGGAGQAMAVLIAGIILAALVIVWLAFGVFASYRAVLAFQDGEVLRGSLWGAGALIVVMMSLGGSLGARRG